MAINYPTWKTLEDGHGTDTFLAAAHDAENWTETERKALLAISQGKGSSSSFGSGRRYIVNNIGFLGHDTDNGYSIGLIQ